MNIGLLYANSVKLHPNQVFSNVSLQMFMFLDTMD